MIHHRKVGEGASHGIEVLAETLAPEPRFPQSFFSTQKSRFVLQGKALSVGKGGRSLNLTHPALTYHLT